MPMIRLQIAPSQRPTPTDGEPEEGIAKNDAANATSPKWTPMSTASAKLQTDAPNSEQNINADM